MPSGNDPPTINMPSSVFSTLSGYTYNSANRAFDDGAGNMIFLFVEKTSSGPGGQWFYGTDTQGGKNPKGEIPTLTSNIILNGTLNGTTGVMTYNSVNYKIRLERDGNGVPVANAFTV